MIYISNLIFCIALCHNNVEFYELIKVIGCET